MSREKTPVQEALCDLRKRLKLTQWKLCAALDVGPVTVARWETSRPPSGYSLLQLENFARANNQIDIAKVFEAAIHQENPEAYMRLGWKLQLGAASAVEQIYENREVLEGDYLKLLKVLERVHARMLKRFMPESTGYRDWLRTHQDLKWEIEDEEKQQKTRP